MRSRVYIKVLGNFGFLIVILIAMTILVMNILGKIEHQYKSATSDLQFLGNLEKIRSEITDIPEYLNFYSKSKSPEYKTIYLSSIKEFDQDIQELKNNSPDSSIVQSLELVSTLFNEWIMYVAEQRVKIAESNSSSDSIRRASEQLDMIELQGNYLASARSNLISIIQSIIARQKIGIDNSNRLGGELLRFILMVNILFAFFAIVLGFYLTHDITKPLTLLKAGTRNIMESKFVTVDVKRGDEFGELAGDFNTMSRMLQENYTRVKAYSDLMTTLNQNESLLGVVSESLDLICEQTKAGIGAVYIFNHASNKLELTSGFALPTERTAVSSYAVGEGIPGECARLKKVLEITDGTEQYSVNAGVSIYAPKYVYAFPIVFQENLIGVIVLGSLQQFSALNKEMIEGALPQIGVAVTNAQNLETTQQLSKEISQKANELNVKNQELEKAYRVKSDFLSNMSHELRTPLNSIIGFTSILLGERGDPLTSDQRKAMEKVLKNGRHLLQLINDILDFSKIEAGRMHISVETESIESVVSGAIMTTEHLIRQKNLEISLEIEQNLPLFRTDVLKIKQVIVNLLSNAAKFTDQGGIFVKAWQQNGLVHVSVKDSGIGIEEKNIEKVFEEFQQIDTSHSRKYKGTGLGLPIARRLARLLGGDLRVESKIGEGSKFILAVPAELPKASTEHSELKKEISAKPKESAAIAAPIPSAPIPPLVQTQSASAFIPKLEPASFPPISKPIEGEVRVLCIDDEPDVIDILRGYLTPEGYTVFSANNGNDGIRLAEKLQPSLITLDIQMPEKDGWETLKDLKSNPFTRDIPVIIHSIVDNKPLAFSLGAVDYMPKPADAATILRMVRKAVSSTDNYILVVEDELDYNMLLQKFIRDAGFAVDGVFNGKEALEKVEQNIPALILLDLKMPVMDGFKTIKHLKAKSEWVGIPIIIITGIELSKEQREEFNALTIDFLKKTEYSMESLSQIIKKTLTPKPNTSGYYERI